MSVWVSIDRAPRDGTAVDLWGRLYDPATTTPAIVGSLAPRRWTNCRWGRATPGHSGLAGPKIEAWWHIEDGYFYRIYPTHYMPIPAGPAT